MTYVHISSSTDLPDLAALRPFHAVLVIEDSVDSQRQFEISKWLCESGCLYMMAWGNGCESWDDSVDLANLAAFEYAEIPDDEFVITTWHTDETLADVFGFCKHCAFHPSVDILNDIVLHLSPEACLRRLTECYMAA